MAQFRIARRDLIVFAAAALLAPAAHAQGTHVKIYAGPAYVAPMSDDDITINAINDTIEAEKQVGWNLGVEFRPLEKLGIEVDYVNATQDVRFGGGVIGDATFSPLTATLNFHVLSTRWVDLYLGPSYSYVNWGDIDLNGGGEIETDKTHSWGASIGLDVGIGKRFAICGGIKYLDVELRLNDGQRADVKPLVARLGAAVRF